MPEHPTAPRSQEPKLSGPEPSDPGSLGLEETSQVHPLPSSMPTGLDQPPTEPEDDLDASAYARDLFGPSPTPGILGQLEHYNVLKLIGRGAMGLVFLAFDTKLQRIVAIKVLAAHLASSSVARRRFLREARAAAAINHPNIVTVFGVGEYRSIPYLVTEFIGGGSLSRTIRAQAPIDPDRLARLGVQLALGLAEAHARGLIHRDVKPANLLLEDCGERIKISDFGLAQALLDPSESASPGQLAGTPTYMAPEILAGEPATPRSDLFSLGCVLYAMVQGRSPFVGRNFLEVAHRIETERPRPLTEIDPRVPPNLAGIVEGLLEKSPELRSPPTAARLAEALQTFNSPRRVPLFGPSPGPRVLEPAESGPAPDPEEAPASQFSPRSEGPPGSPPPRRPRRRAGLFVALAALLLLGAGGTALWWTWSQGEAKRDSGGARILAQGEDCPNYDHGERVVLSSGLPWLKAVAADSQGRRFVVGGGYDTRARVWDREKGRILTLLEGHASWIQAVDVSRDGNLVATASGGSWAIHDGRREGGDDFTIRLWRLDRQAPQVQLFGHTGPLTAVEFSPDGRSVASAGRDRSVRIWSLDDHQTHARFQSSLEVLCLAYHPSGRSLLSGTWDSATLWDIATGKPIEVLDCSPGIVLAVAISPDGRIAVTANRKGPVRLWELDNLDAPPRELPRRDGWANDVAFSEDGRRLLTANSSGEVRVWDPDSLAELAVFSGTNASANSACFCRRGSEIVAAYEDGTVRLWKVPGSPESP